MRFISLFLFLLLAFSQSGFAKGYSELKDGGWVFYGAGDLLFSNSKADGQALSTYTQKYNKSSLLALGLGVKFFRFLYIGVRYEYWMAGRNVTTAGLNSVDTLQYQTLGGELGIYTGNPRIHWLLTGGAYYPLSLAVTQSGATSGKYTNTANPLGYQARLTLGIKLGSVVSMRFEGGYRVVDLGSLTNAVGSYLPGGDKLDLSGPFVGVGFGVHF